MPQGYEPYFSDLRDLLARMIEAVREVPLPTEIPWENDAQVLAIKLFRHACSLKQLAEGIMIEWDNDVGATFIDHASLKAVARAQMETLLVFSYIFGSGDENLTAYRHMTWRLGGLMDRLKLNASMPATKAKQQADKNEADTLLALLAQLPNFKTETSKRRKQILLGEWRHGLSWQKLGEAAGFHPVYFRDVYNFLCGYSHSSWASILQISQAKTVEAQAAMADAVMGMATAVMARFISAYSTYFPVAAAINMSAPAKKALEYWSFGKDEMAAHYGKGSASDLVGAP